MRSIHILILLFLCSCQVYHSNFDCPPGCGVPCKSVTEIEAMIIETPEGPDIFLGEIHQEGSCDPKHRGFPCERHQQRIWIPESVSSCGTYIQQGHYIYFGGDDDLATE